MAWGRPKRGRAVKGTSLIEMGLLVGVVGVIAVAAVATLGEGVRTAWEDGTATLSQTTIEAQAPGTTYQGEGWNIAFLDNCGLPSYTPGDPSFGWVEAGGQERLQVTLHPGQQGSCSSDATASSGIPYWERAEVRQTPLMAGGGVIHDIAFTVQFRDGWVGDRETFFQIHGFHATCNSSPILMMKWDDGFLDVDVLRQLGQGGNPARGRHTQVAPTTIEVGDWMDRDIPFRVLYDSALNGTVSVWMDGVPIVTGAALQTPACAQPHAKIGAYRPHAVANETSRAWFHGITVASNAP